MAKSEQELMKELFPQAYGKASAQNDGKVSNNNAAAANEQLNKGAGPMKVQPTKQQSPIADAITPNYGGAQKQATSAASAASAEVGLRNPQSNSGVNYRARISQLVPTGENENISILPKTEKKGFMFGGLKAQSESKKEPSRWVKGSYKRTPTVDSIGRSGTKIGRYKILSESEYENGGFSRGGSYDSYVRNVLGHIKSSSDKSESDGASKYLDEISRDEQGVKSVPLTKFGLMTEHEYKARGGKDYDRYINDETSKLIPEKRAIIDDAEEKIKNASAYTYGDGQNSAGAIKEQQQKRIDEAKSDLDILEAERGATDSFKSDEEERKYSEWKMKSLGDFIKKQTDGFSPDDPKSVSDYVISKIRSEFNTYPKRSVSADISGKYNFENYIDGKTVKDDGERAEDLKFASRFLSENPEMITGSKDEKLNKEVGDYFGGFSRYYDSVKNSVAEFSETQKALGGKEFYKDKENRKKALDILDGKTSFNGADFGLLTREQYDERYPQTVEAAGDADYLDYLFEGITANLSEMKGKAEEMSYHGMVDKYGDWYKKNFEAAKSLAAALDMRKKIRNASGKKGVLSESDWKKLGSKINSSYEDYLADAGTDESSARYTKDLYGRLEPVGSMEAESDEVNRRLKTAKLVVDSYDREKKYMGKEFDNTEGGQFKANFALGSLGIESNKLWYEYEKTGSRDALAAAKKADEITEDFSRKNRTIIEDENKNFKWVTKSLAQHLPQEIDQAKYGAVPAIFGGTLGLFAGHPFIGARLGLAAGSVGEGYVQMTGDAMRSMVNAGLDYDEAKELAENEGIINSIIESGGELIDIGVDFALAGVGMGDFFSGKISSLGEKGLMKLGVSGKTAKKAVKAATTGGALLTGAAGEGAEEVEQSMVSKANERIAKNIAAGKLESKDMLHLLGEASNLSLYSDEDWKEMFGQDGWEGFKVGLMMSAIHGGGIKAANSVTNLLQKNTASQIGASLHSEGMESPVILNALMYGDDATKDMVRQYEKVVTGDGNISEKGDKAKKLLGEIFKATQERVQSEAEASEKELNASLPLKERLKTAASSAAGRVLGVEEQGNFSESEIDANTAANRITEGRGFENDIALSLSDASAKAKVIRKLGIDSALDGEELTEAVRAASKERAKEDISESLKRAKLEDADEVSALISNISETPGAMRRLSRLYTAADRDLKSNIGFTKESGLKGVLDTDLAILSGNKNYIDEQYIRSFADMWAKSAEKSNAWVLEKSGMNTKDFADTLSNYVLGNEDLPAGGMRRIADGMKAAIANHAAFLSENSGDGFFAAQAESLNRSVPLALAVLETGSERGALINRNLNDYTGGTYYDYGRRNYGNSDYAERTSDNRTAINGEQGTEHGFGRDFKSGQRGVRQAVQRTYTEGERRSFKDGNGNEVSYTEVTASDENTKAIADYTKLFGYDCQFVKGLNADGYPLNGMRRGKTIYLDIENESIKQTQGHELLHAIKQKVGGGYEELRSKSVSFIGMEKFGVIRDRYIDLYRELYSKNSFDEMTDAEKADMWDIIDEEIMADIVGFVRDGDTESLMDIFGYSIESVSDILDTVNAILDEGQKGAATENSNAVNYQAESDNAVVELSHDNELSKRIEGLRGAAKYKAITDYILEALSEQPITMSDGTKVIVNKRDAQHISHDAATRKTAHISEIKSLVENAKLFAVDDNPDHTNYKLFKYYAANVRYDGQEYPVYLNVGESRNGSGYHLYDITQKIRETARRINGVGRVNYDLRPENGFSTNNIPQNSGNVNTNVRKNSENITENSENGKNSARFQAKTDAVITEQDIKAVQRVGKKSINDFTSEDIKNTESFARKYFNEMGTKSPFFRAWFGDWRANDTTPLKTVVVETIDLSEAILKNGDYYVPDTDWTIHAGKTLREETKHYARGEKVSVKALTTIKDILDNAILLDTEVSGKTSKNKAVNTAFMHKLYCPIQYNNNTYIAKISVEEFLNASNNIERKAYHLQSIKIETADGHAIDNNVSISMSRSDAVSIDTISQLFDLVKQNDKNFNPKPASKVVNEDGTPRIVYHGTNTDFWTFDKGRLGSGNDQYGAGFYFASEKASAQSYGNRVVEAYLDMKSPYEFSVNDESPNLIALGRSQPLTEEQTYEVLKRIPNIYDDEESILGDYYEEYWESGAQDWMIRDLAANEFNRNIGELDAGLFRDFPNELHEALRDVTGHDGILLKFKDGSEFYVPWFANQIKSATDNIGTFDTANDDIRFQASGEKYEHAYDEDKADKGFMSSVDTDMLSFIDKAVADSADNKSVYIIGKNTDRLNRDIKALTGIDTSLFNHSVKVNSLRHIVKEHGIDGTTDRTMANADDIARMGYVINNYDTVKLLDSASREYRDKNQKPAPMIKLSKKIDGTYYVVEAVPDTRAKSLAVVSAYIEKAPARQTEDVQAPSSNARDASADTGTSPGIISQEAQKVKTENTKYQRGRAAKYDTRTVEEKEIDRLQHEVERLSKRNKYLEAETKVSADGTRRVEGLWLKPITEDLIGATGTELTKRYIAKQLREGYERMLNKPQGEGMTREEAKLFYDLALEIMENTYTDEGERFREFVSKLDIGIDPKHAPDILGERGKEAVKEAHRRGMKIKKGVGVPYQFDADLPELRYYYPEFVTEEDLDSPWQNFAMKAADWIKSRDDILKSNYSYANEGIVRNETGMSVDEFRFELAKQMIDYARIGGIKQYKTLADKLADAKAELKARGEEQKQSEKVISSLTKENARLKEAADIISENLQLTRADKKRIADGALRKIVRGFKKMADSTVKTGEFGDIVKELFSAVINREENGITDAEISAIAKKAASKLIGGTELNGAEAEQQIEVYSDLLTAAMSGDDSFKKLSDNLLENNGKRLDAAITEDTKRYAKLALKLEEKELQRKETVKDVRSAERQKLERRRTVDGIKDVFKATKGDIKAEFTHSVSNMIRNGSPDAGSYIKEVTMAVAGDDGKWHKRTYKTVDELKAAQEQIPSWQRKAPNAVINYAALKGIFKKNISGQLADAVEAYAQDNEINLMADDITEELPGNIKSTIGSIAEELSVIASNTVEEKPSIIMNSLIAKMEKLSDEMGVEKKDIGEIQNLIMDAYKNSFSRKASDTEKQSRERAFRLMKKLKAAVEGKQKKKSPTKGYYNAYYTLDDMLASENDDLRALAERAKALLDYNINTSKRYFNPMRAINNEAVKEQTGRTFNNYKEFISWMTSEVTKNENEAFTDSLVRRAQQINKYYVNANSVNAITMAQVDEILDTVPAFLKQLSNQNRLLRSECKGELDDKVRAALRVLPDIKPKTKIRQAREWAKNQWRDWRVIFNRLSSAHTDSPLYTLAHELVIADTTGANTYRMRAYQKLDDYLQDGKYMKALQKVIAKKEYNELSDMGGKQKVTIEFTRGLLISLYMHNRMNEMQTRKIDIGGKEIEPAILNANQRHIQYGGIIVPDIERVYKNRLSAAYGDYAQGRIKLTPSEIKELTEEYLTDRDKKFANACAEYFEDAKEQTNNVSRELEGMDIAKVDKYFPISSDKTFIDSADFITSFGQSESDSSSVLNPSSHKARVEGAANPIRLIDIAQVMENAIEADAAYISKAIPLSNLNKLLGKNIYATDSMTSMREQIRRKAGDWYLKWMNQWLKGIQGKVEDRRSRFEKASMSHFASAKLTANEKVGIGQRMAYTAVEAELGFAATQKARFRFNLEGDIEGLSGKNKYFKGPWNNSAIDREISKYSPVMWSRGRGYSSVERGEATKSKIGKYTGKLIDTTTRNDLAMMRRIWFACVEWGKAQAKDGVNGFKEGMKSSSEEFKKLVGKKFDEVVLFTQNSYEYSQRAAILWRDKSLLGWLAMFRSDKMKYNSMTQTAFDTLMFRKKDYYDLKKQNASEKEIKQAKREAAAAFKKLAFTEGALFRANLKYQIFTRVLFPIFSPSAYDDEPLRDEQGRLSLSKTVKQLKKLLVLDRFSQAGAVWNAIAGVIEVADIDLLADWVFDPGSKAKRDALIDSLGEKELLSIPAIDMLNGIVALPKKLAATVDDIKDGDYQNAFVDSWSQIRLVTEYLTGAPIAVIERYIKEAVFYGRRILTGDDERARVAVKYLGNRVYKLNTAKEKELSDWTAQDLYKAFKGGNLTRFGDSYYALAAGLFGDGVDDISSINKKMYSLYGKEVSEGVKALDKTYDGKWSMKIQYQDGKYYKTVNISTAKALEDIRKKLKKKFNYDIMDKVERGISDVPEGIEISGITVDEKEMTDALHKIGAISDEAAREGASGSDYSEKILNYLMADKWQEAADVWNAANEFNSSISVKTDSDKAEVMTKAVESKYQNAIKEKLLGGDKSVDGKFNVKIKWEDKEKGKTYEARATTVDDYFMYKKMLQDSGYKWDDVAGDITANTDDIDNRLNKIGVADPVSRYGTEWYMSAYYTGDPAALNTYQKNAIAADKYEDWDAVKEDMHSGYKKDAQSFEAAGMEDEVNARIDGWKVESWNEDKSTNKAVTYDNYNDYKYAIAQLEEQGYTKKGKKSAMAYKVTRDYNYDPIDDFIESAKVAGSYGDDWTDKEKKAYMNYVGKDIINHQPISYETAYASPQEVSSNAQSSDSTVGNAVPTEGEAKEGAGITYKSSSYTKGSGKSGGNKGKSKGNGGKKPLTTNADSLGIRSLITGEAYGDTVSLKKSKNKGSAKDYYHSLISKYSGGAASKKRSTYKDIMRAWFGN